jgi:p38 MAP kinase
MEQYRLIIDLCGSPDEELMRKIEEQNSPAMRMVVERMSKDEKRDGLPCQRKHFASVFAHIIPDDAIDLLDKILVLDPDRRISVEEALQHPYMKEYSLPSDEPTADHPFNIEEYDASQNINDWKCKFPNSYSIQGNFLEKSKKFVKKLKKNEKNHLFVPPCILI